MSRSLVRVRTGKAVSGLCDLSDLVGDVVDVVHFFAGETMRGGVVFRRVAFQVNQRRRSLCAGLCGGLCAAVARWRGLRRFDVRGRKVNNSVM